MFQLLKNKSKLNSLKRKYTQRIEDSKSLSDKDKIEKQKLLQEAQMLLTQIDVLSKC
ncbi:Lacal_2735 family protein [Bizionia gelidisalsuginis]|uniref:Lacal_2735 family protein n=2 Tax=Bizionia TaxID=283785 RepID=A0A8H2QE70_9FLAO|nr:MULTISPECIES: Lacal_2735 family protein [Bizionia]TYB73136.1 Lacal_2735 family protein [Bizionia saleffrena]TYC14905.1 Lacal_2735 family protein [Bizionia gelidisalsuginis]